MSLLLRQLHYASMNLLLVLNLWALTTGGIALWFGFVAALLISTVVDEAAGDNSEVLGRGQKRFLDLMLHLTLPLMALNAAALVLLFGTGDAFGVVPALRSLGIDIAAVRASSGPVTLTGALLGTGLFVGAAATNVAHELVHRLHSSYSMVTGRWLLAFSFDTTFSIEHVHGHHRLVCTPADPATARRGEYPLAFFLRSTIHGNLSAVRLEAERLKRRNLPVWSPQNRIITGQLMSLTLVAAAFALGGWWGVAAFVIAGVQGKMYLELVNFIEHYGLVRAPGGRIEPRHAWNTYRRVSSALLYNLPRHSHHHMFATKPYWTLEAEPEGPTYPYGYMSMILISLVPPLWRRTVDPLLETWDGTMASEAERAILLREGTLLGRRPQAAE
jgi:alkane 1-monooxygenase